jgi:Zn-dependent protease with chaperone function/Tfp pilus assembly protein PilF
MSILQATYFDGKFSRKHAVNVIISGSTLKVVGRDINANFDAKGVRRSLRVANTPRWLYLPGGGACVTSDNDAVDRMTRDRRYERLLHTWESRPAFAAIAIALVAAAVWLLIDRAVPRAVDYAAMHIPVETETALGEQTLRSLEQGFLQPSKLPQARQAALRAKFDAMVQLTRDGTKYRLEFRASPVVGPNAFALPSGIIVMTDELVKYSNNDLEVLGVLAHELGHVHHRHTMRRLLEGSATALIIAGITGDVASATSLAAAAPALLLQTKYSRDNEREADRYAVEMMRKANYNPGHLAAILVRMSAKGPKRGGLPPFMSSHPPTEERDALARAGTGAPVPASDNSTEADSTQAALVPEKPKGKVIDPVHRDVVTLIEQRDIEGLERLLGGHQQAFEADAGNSKKLDHAFDALGKIPRSAQAVLDEWCKARPTSYAAHLARAYFFYHQGLDARGTAYSRDTPEENMRSMRLYFEKAQADLERSLTLTPKPYASHLTLMSIARTSGSGSDEKAHYQAAVKLAPQSIELRLAHMANLEPRWGGSYKAMEAFEKESRAQLTDPKAADRLAARIPANRASDYKRQKDWSKALTFYNESIALYEGANALCERAVVQSQLNREIEAMADANRALAKQPFAAWCFDNIVWVARRASNGDEAIALFNQVIEANPNHGEAFAQRGWHYQQKNNKELAFRDYLAAAKLGDAWGELMAGKYLWSGIGVAQDQAAAMVWFRKAAEKGHPDATLTLKQALEQLAKKQ